MTPRSTPLTCPDCNGRLRADAGTLVCARGHRLSAPEGFFNLWPRTDAPPRLDLFSTPYGWLYDTGVKERTLARLAARVIFGADVGPMYDLMDAGVRCAPGEVVVDVPCGGAPVLRTAPGRMRGTYIGIDLSEEMLRRAVAVKLSEGLGDEVILARGDAFRLPLVSGTVDRLLCFNGLHVMPDKPALLGEFRRVLKPGGELWGSVLVDDGVPARHARPWLRPARAFFHPADAGALEGDAHTAGFAAWETSRSGPQLVFSAHAAGVSRGARGRDA
jgi:SAM-dependent methyltransferase